MSKIGFTGEMLKALKSLKGKTFKSNECRKEAGGKLSAAFGNLRINLGRSSVELKCGLELVEDYVGGPDEVATLSCEKVNPKSAFVPYFGERAVAYMVDEPIKGVELVRDHAVYTNAVNGDVCVIDMDMDIALVIRAKHHAFCFSINEDFYEEIDISITEADSSDFGIKRVEDFWDCAEDLTVEASREFVRL